jgi:hypothetical protein
MSLREGRRLTKQSGVQAVFCVRNCFASFAMMGKELDYKFIVQLTKLYMCQIFNQYVTYREEMSIVKGGSPAGDVRRIVSRR